MSNKFILSLKRGFKYFVPWGLFAEVQVFAQEAVIYVCLVKPNLTADELIRAKERLVGSVNTVMSCQ